MKTIMLSFLIAFSPGLLLAQSFERSVLPACGGTYFDGNNTIIDYTVGEIAITKLTSFTTVLTQGFQQPYSNSFVAIAEDSDDPLQVLIFPNPVYDQLNVTIANGKEQDYIVNIYNVLGQLLMSQKASSGFDNKMSVVFDFHYLVSGNYFISVLHDQKPLITEKIIKINQ